jgi:hypothetical protein
MTISLLIRRARISTLIIRRIAVDEARSRTEIARQPSIARRCSSQRQLGRRRQHIATIQHSFRNSSRLFSRVKIHYDYDALYATHYHTYYACTVTNIRNRLRRFIVPFE